MVHQLGTQRNLAWFWLLGLHCVGLRLKEWNQGRRERQEVESESKSKRISKTSFFFLPDFGVSLIITNVISVLYLGVWLETEPLVGQVQIRRWCYLLSCVKELNYG